MSDAKSSNVRRCGLFKRLAAGLMAGLVPVLLLGSSLALLGAGLGSVDAGAPPGQPISTLADDEHSLVVTAAGDTLYAAWERAGRVDFGRSTDRGATWTIRRDVLEQSASNPTIAACPNGTVYLAAWQQAEAGTPTITFARSTDGGDNWQPTLWTTSTVTITGEFPDVGVDACCRVYLVWQNPTLEIPNPPGAHPGFPIQFSRSQDGLTFTRSITVESNHGWYDPPKLAVSPSGNHVYVVWKDAFHWYQLLAFTRSTDGGQTWEARQEPGPGHLGHGEYSPRIAARGEHDVYLVWDVDSFGEQRIVFRRSIDAGATWQQPVNVSDLAYSSSGATALTVDGAGRVYVAWDNDLYGDHDVFFDASRDGGTTFGSDLVVASGQGDQRNPALAISTDFIFVGWEHGPEGERDLYGASLPTMWMRLYLPLVLKAYPITLPGDAEDRARAWLDHQTVHFRRAEDIPGYNRDGCSGQVVRYKDGQKKICQPAIPGDALVSFDYCNYGTTDQQRYLGRYGRAFLYDQAVGAIAWLMAGEQEKARRLLDHLSSYQNLNVPVPGATDGSFGYSFNTVGCPEYAPDNRDSFYDMDYLRNGAISWASYAFVLYQRLTGDTRYLDVAHRTAEYLLTQQVNDPADPRFGLLRGGHGTYDTTTWEFTPGQIEWVSTEHNVDAYFFLRDLGMLTGDARYRLAAQQIRDGLLTKLWNEEKGRLDQGLDPEGHPDGVDALDAASWGAMFLLAAGEEDRARRSLSFAERTYWNQADGAWGYKPYAGMVEGVCWDAVRMVWSEGSLGMAMAYVKLGDAASLNRARTILAELARLQERDPDGGLLYAVYDGDDLTDFPRAPSVGSTGWLVMTLRALAAPTVRDGFWGAIP